MMNPLSLSLSQSKFREATILDTRITKMTGGGDSVRTEPDLQKH